MRRSPFVLTSATLICALAVALPAGSAPPPADAVAGAGDGVVTSHDVTLITGDRVSLTVYPDGRQAATVDAAERPDGSTPGFHKHELDGHLLVVPADVVGDIPDRLDPGLFDVTGLVDQGYDDASRDTIPVIVEHAQPETRLSAEAIPAFTPARVLESVGAVAGTVAKADAAEMLEGVAGTARSTELSHGVERIWLDQQAVALDEVSAPQIGAPDAWESGFTGAGVTIAVIDTGVDSSHPDLAGKVVAEANFTETPTAADGFGHGTHVASIAAGSGAASDGLRKGIAYDARLLSAKVLNDAGSGAMSQVIDGMEWAVDNGADVVNLSLGIRGEYTDGSDPASQSVDRLSAESGALFVIAAGNDGPGDGTVTVPGTATSALTVGAVDRNDRFAGFSSRGPRAGDFALKPDVTAPGVGIIAARAAGTSMGSPVDDRYTAADGTSMAAPHVAGAAAVLLGQRPELGAQDLKSLLMSTGHPAGPDVYHEGGGRIDLANATDAEVFATGSLSLGYFPYPQDGAKAVSGIVEYRNTGDVDVVLTVAADVRSQEGVPATDAQLSVEPATVTVPAGGSAQTRVRVDPTQGTFGVYGGYLVATSTAGDVVARTAVGFTKESERYQLTVRGTARDGRPAAGISTVDVVNVDDVTTFLRHSVPFSDGTVTMRVPPGRYSVAGYLFTYDEPHVFATQSVATIEPEVEVSADTTVVLDARDSAPVEVDTPDPTKPTVVTMNYVRADPAGGQYSHSYSMSYPVDEAFASPTAEVGTGEFEFYSQLSLLAPDIRITPLDGSTALDAEYVFNSARLDGRFDTELVYAGLGRESDFAGADVAGKVALIRRGDITFFEKIRNAEAAGALAAVIFNHSPGLLLFGGDPNSVPTLSMTQAAGEALVAKLEQGPMRVDVLAETQSPYLYEGLFVEPGRIPGELSYAMSASNTARIDARYRSHLPAHGIGELRHKWRPWELFSFGFLRRTASPQTRNEYVSPAGDTRWAQYFYGNSTDSNPFGAPMQSESTVLGSRQKGSVSWGTQVVAPGPLPDFGDPTYSSAYRAGSSMVLNVPEWSDAQAHWGWKTPEDTTAFRLFRDGELVATGDRAVGEFDVGSGPATYRIELDVDRSEDWWTYSTRTSTSWTLPLGTATGGAEVLPLLTVTSAVDLDQLNRVSRAHRLTLRVGHQPGAATAPIAGAELSVSTDDGATWRVVPLERRGGGEFEALIASVPHGADALSTRIEAWDEDGHRIRQEVIRAYGLR